MFGFFSMSASKVASAISTLSKYLIMKLSGDGFNRERNNVFLDESSNYSLVTPTGNVTQGSLNPFNTNVGWFFDGSGDYLSVPSNTAFSMGTGDFTWEAWINGPTPASQSTILTNTIQAATGDTVLGIYVGTSNQLIVSTYITVIATSANNVITPNTWNHVAMTRTGTTLRVFVNGTSVISTTNSMNFSSQLGPTIGSEGTARYYTGYISNLRIVKGIAVYTSTFVPPSNNLTAIANTSLLTCQNTYLVDNSTNKFAITVSGETQPRPYGPFDMLASSEFTTIPSRSVYFDGTGDYLSLASNVAFSMGTGDFTWEAWIYPTSWANANHAVYATTATGGLFIGKIGSDFAVRAYGVANQITSGTFPTLNVWTHIAAVRSGTTLKLYYNGVEVASTTNSYSFAQAAVRIGADDGGATYTGYISNLRLVKGTAVYTGNFTPSTSPLTAISGTSLLTCQGGVIADSSTNNFTITTVGDARVTANSPFSVGSSGVLQSGSAYFDGSGDYLSIPNSASHQFGSTPFTIEGWIWTNSGATQGVIGNYQFGINNGWRVTITATSMTYGAGASAGAVASFSGASLARSWNHFAIVGDGTTVRVYINGTAGGVSGAQSSGVTTSSYLSIGKNSDDSGGVTWPFSGYLSNLRIVKGTAVYNANFTPSSSPVTNSANTTLLLNFRNAGIYDGVGDNIFETIGDAALSTVQKKTGNTSMFFDGSGDYITAINPMLACGTGDFTVEFWMYSADVSGAAQRGMLQTSTTAGGLATTYTTGLTFLQGSNRLFGALNGGLIVIVAGVNVGSNSAVVTTNTWTHVAIARVSGTATLYINGTSVDSRTASGSITATNIAIGGYYSSAYLYSGYLDDLRIQNSAKYTANFTPS